MQLVYMQARYYDPVIGRFYSNDPVGTLSHLGSTQGIHGFNRYAYVSNNPYKYTDPDGEAAKLVKAAFNVVRNASKNGWDFKKAGADEIAGFVDNVATLADGQFTADDVFAAIDIATGFGGEAKGVIYKVSGKNTDSGKDYIGRTTNPEARLNAQDGRDREGAEIIGTYDNTRSGRVQEQRAIDQNGGVENLDNKRNEIAESKRDDYGV